MSSTILKWFYFAASFTVHNWIGALACLAASCYFALLQYDLQSKEAE